MKPYIPCLIAFIIFSALPRLFKNEEFIAMGVLFVILIIDLLYMFGVIQIPFLPELDM